MDLADGLIETLPTSGHLGETTMIRDCHLSVEQNDSWQRAVL